MEGLGGKRRGWCLGVDCVRDGQTAGQGVYKYWAQGQDLWRGRDAVRRVRLQFVGVVLSVCLQLAGARPVLLFIV